MTVVDWFNRLTQKNMFSVRNMYPFWFITWDDFPLRNYCSESAHVRNGERPWNMGTAQNYIMGYPLWIGGVNSSFNGTSFLWIFHSPVWLPEGTTQKNRIVKYSTWPILCPLVPTIFLFSHRLNRKNFGGPRSKKNTAPKDGDGFSNKHNCELPHRPLAIEECA